MDMNGLIDLSKVVNPIHFERMIEYLLIDNEQNIYMSEDELYDVDSIKRMINWRKQDWLKINQEMEK